MRHRHDGRIQHDEGFTSALLLGGGLLSRRSPCPSRQCPPLPLSPPPQPLPPPRSIGPLSHVYGVVCRERLTAGAVARPLSPLYDGGSVAHARAKVVVVGDGIGGIGGNSNYIINGERDQVTMRCIDEAAVSMAAAPARAVTSGVQVHVGISARGRATTARSSCGDDGLSDSFTRTRHLAFPHRDNLWNHGQVWGALAHRNYASAPSGRGRGGGKRRGKQPNQNQKGDLNVGVGGKPDGNGRGPSRSDGRVVGSATVGGRGGGNRPLILPDTIVVPPTEHMPRSLDLKDTDKGFDNTGVAATVLDVAATDADDGGDDADDVVDNDDDDDDDNDDDGDDYDDYDDDKHDKHDDAEIADTAKGKTKRALKGVSRKGASRKPTEEYAWKLLDKHERGRANKLSAEILGCNSLRELCTVCFKNARWNEDNPIVHVLYFQEMSPKFKVGSAHHPLAP